MKIYLIDSSLLKESDCELKTHLIYNEGLTTNGNTFVMQYGTAGHKALALYYKGNPIEECLKVALQHYLSFCTQPPPGDHRTIEHLGETLKGYFKTFPREADALKVGYSPIDNTKPLIEITFPWPYLKNDSVEVIVCGTIDFIGTYCGEKVIVDHKFTSVHYPEKFFDGLSLNIQTIFYPWLLKQTGIVDNLLPVIINGIFIQRPSVRSNKIKEAQYIRSPFIQYTEEQLIKFEKWLDKRIKQIINDTEHLPNYARCETIYGKCQFFDLCRIKDQYKNSFIEQNFARRIYNPLNFQS